MNERNHEGATFLHHVPCDACGSKDNAGLYSDGHTFCFGCGAHANNPDSVNAVGTRAKPKVKGKLLTGEVSALSVRKITEATCEKFGYKTGSHKGKPVQIAPYYNADGQLIAQKVRGAGKKFVWVGDPEDALPFGANVWPKTGKMLVVTEGEIDALSMSQVQGNKWPVVSIGCGAGAQMKKYIGKHRDYFNGFEKVILMFDSDQPGRDAAKSAAEVIGAKAHIAELPLKDANEMLVAGRTDELINAMWKAKQYQPEGIVDMASLEEDVIARPREGLSWPWPQVTKMTYGIRKGEIVGLGAGTGVGKTDLFMEIAQHFMAVHKEKIGMFFLEQRTAETALRLINKFVKKPLHIPEYWNEELFRTSWDGIVKENQVFLYDSFGRNDWSVIQDKIEYLHHSQGVNVFFLDHLTALVAGEEDERLALDRIMEEMASLAQKLDINIFYISHLATPEGKPHEEGGRVYMRHFRGSRSIGFWTHFVFGLERNQQADDPIERSTTTLRCLKDRNTGRATGECVLFVYDRETGMLEPKDDTAAEYGLTNENKPTTGNEDF